MRIIHEYVRLLENDIEAGFFSSKDSGESQVPIPFNKDAT